MRTGARRRSLQLGFDYVASDQLLEFAVNTSGDLGMILDRRRNGTFGPDGTQAPSTLTGEVHAIDARGDVLLASGPVARVLRPADVRPVDLLGAPRRHPPSGRAGPVTPMCSFLRLTVATAAAVCLLPVTTASAARTGRRRARRG